MTVRLLQGHALDVLATLPERHVHCVVTSIPYYGLRAYGTDPQVWGGDGSCGGEHVWSALPEKSRRGQAAGATAQAGNTQRQVCPPTIGHGSVCGRCGAWLGEYGQEPLHDCGRWTRGPEPPCSLCYVCHTRMVFAAVWRVLRDDGTLWLNAGDSYASVGKAGPWDAGRSRGKNGRVLYAAQANRGYVPGLKAKDLCMLPARLALALQADGWTLRSEIVWCKAAPMPESVQDRPTSAHERVYLLAKRARYYYDAVAVQQPAASTHPSGNGYARPERVSLGGRGQAEGWQPSAWRNLWSYWVLNPEPLAENHFAAYPTELPRRCVAAATSEHGVCSACGAPWRRVVERTSVVPQDYEGKWLQADPQAAARRMAANLRARREAGGVHDQPFPAPQTTGWVPTCRCPAGTPTRPAVVLDVFVGSGTTCLVAERLGRDSIGIELNPSYLALARRRIEGEAPLLTTVETAPPVPPVARNGPATPTVQQRPLWEEHP